MTTWELMIWQVLPLVFGISTLALAAVAFRLHRERTKLLARYGSIIDIDRELTLRRHAFSLELARKESVFNSELASRRRAIESELAKHSADLELARRVAATVN